MTTVTKKLYLDLDGNWQTSLETPEDLGIEAFLNSVKYDGDLSSLLADQGSLSTSADYKSRIEDKVFNNNESYVRPLLKSELSSYETRESLMAKLLSDVQKLQTSRNAQHTFGPDSDNETTEYSNMPMLVGSSVLPGLKLFRVPSMQTSADSYEAADSRLTSALGALTSVLKYSNNPSYSPLSAKLVRVSKPRNDLDSSIVYPGDLVRLLASGGAGNISINSPRMSRVNPLLDIFKVISTATGISPNTISDSNGSNVTVNINIQLPSNYTSAGEDEDI